MSRKQLHEHVPAWRSSAAATTLIYIGLTFLVGLVLYWRLPNNVDHANFYGEDGSIYLQNIIDKGWLRAIFSDFNGYFIVGLYAICAVAMTANTVFFGSGLLSLPVWFAITSIATLAAAITLPYLLFRKTIGTKITLAAIALGALLPLPMSPHIVIGTVGNQKWVFMYIAFLLALYRLLHWRTMSLKSAILLDAALLVCAYTNSTAYVLVPFLAIPYTWDWWRAKRRYVALRRLLRTRTLWSLLGLGILLIPQVLYVAIRGIPKMPGYLDNPYQLEKTIEIFINRTYLFGATHIVNGKMNDFIALVGFGMLVFIILRFCTAQEKLIISLGLYAAGMASVLFVLNRPGVSEHFFGYKPGGSGPDQFFYAQTLIMTIPLLLAGQALLRQIPNRHVQNWFFAGGIGALVIAGLVSNAVFGELWRNYNVFDSATGTFADQALTACNQKNEQLTIPVYPYPDGRFALTVGRYRVCTAELTKYQDSAVDLGLTLNNNDHVPVLQSDQIKQTFRSPQAKLDGIRLMIATFAKKRRQTPYRLRLYDADCKQELRRSDIPLTTIDNTWVDLPFAAINTSQNSTYCFSIEPAGEVVDKIAVQLAAPEQYNEGTLYLGDQVSPKDIIFQPLYSQTK